MNNCWQWLVWRWGVLDNTHVYGIYIIYTLYIHYIYIIYIYIHYIYMIYTWYIHDIYMIYTWYIHDIYMVYIHDIYIIFTLYIHYIYIKHIHIYIRHIYIYIIISIYTNTYPPWTSFNSMVSKNSISVNSSFLSHLDSRVYCRETNDAFPISNRKHLVEH